MTLDKYFKGGKSNGPKKTVNDGDITLILKYLNIYIYYYLIIIIIINNNR